ncbi:response regulator transcription factor [[Clostridium] symbiosum]|uniref:response regulator transcription factor n=1 Tax=Clostridium symbiosum TaxID=1512 RepID=UPI001D087188|nr:response regulator transcription factor [[Clostridium] symbiosum]MCB6607408.1 response regulator transcription factor [[Clostridium] symbiosum]MCB6930036.1 response regulator transcription factor [[Clostridium] symbiosum]
MHLIYVVEDDENIRNLICVALKNFGYRPEGFETAEEALDRLGGIIKRGKEAYRELPSMFVFDWMLPGMDGMAAIKKVREMEPLKGTQILMLTAKDRETDIVTGLDNGADDYMTKPFGILELSARVRNLLKRTGPLREESACMAAGDVKIDKETREVVACGEKAELTLKEFELLSYLMEHMNRVVTRDELLDNIWGYDYDGETRTLDMHIKTLRQKLKAAGQQIKTVRGVGYRFLKEKE